MTTINPYIFREYDVRGVVGKDLDAATVRLLGRGFGTWARRRGVDAVALGRDCRLSSPGFRDAAAWGAGAEDGAATEPAARPLPPALRRRTTLLTRMVAEAAAQAADQAGVALGAEPLVFGSAYGEIETAVEMIRSFDGPVGLPSPTRFHNSVHNTAVGYLSIATQNRGFVTALAAGRETAGAALQGGLGHAVRVAQEARIGRGLGLQHLLRRRAACEREPHACHRE